MDSFCAIVGNSDMYGFGIRLGYYLQWIAAIIAPWIADQETESLHVTNTLFVAATFLALIIEVARNTSDSQELQSVEIYIILLFTFGSAFGLVPVLLWRMITRFNPYFDPSRWPKTKPPSRTFNMLYLLLLLAVSAFQVWFWSAGVVQNLPQNCSSWGFLFTKVPIQSPGIRWLSCTLSVLLIFCLLALPAFKLFDRYLNSNELKNKAFLMPATQERKRIQKLYNSIDSCIKLIVAAIVVTAVELTIVWNRIEEVYSVSPVGQTIPLVLGITAIVMLLYKAYFRKNSGDDSKGPTRAPFLDHEPTVVITDLMAIPARYGDVVELIPEEQQEQLEERHQQQQAEQNQEQVPEQTEDQTQEQTEKRTQEQMQKQRQEEQQSKM